MGDVETLIEKAQAAIDEESAAEMEAKIRKATFDFNDFLSQMEQMEKMGDINDLLGMIPGMSSKVGNIDIDPKAMSHPRAIILSMTPEERANPNLINVSRKNRIAKGAGLDIAEVNRFIKQFEQSKKMMKQFSGMMGGGKKKKRFGGFKLPF
jgi:signal recognition particle subunit SRP54